MVLVVLGAASLFVLPAAGAQQTHQVDVTDEAFVPEQITVDSGDTVTWVADLSNQGRHNLIWDIGTWGMWDWVPGRADPYSITFSGAGTYTYHCDFVSSMQGSVVVEAVVPGAPEAVAVVAGEGAVTVSWSPPAFIGGSVLTEYVVTASPGG
ncbi:MAG: cupredoxin domain-containing protein, partial [Egibacteraceae bacterium]